MVIIGINGPMAAGKTTVSKMLFEEEKKEIIHLDYVLNEIKEKYFSKITTAIEIDGDKVRYLNDTSYLKKILKIKYIGLLKEKISSVYAHNLIKEKLKNSDADYLIIEGYTLDKYFLESLCDELIFIKTSNKIRYERLLIRDKIMLKRAISSFKQQLTETKDLNNYRILDNTGDLNSLKDKVLFLEEEIKEKNYQKIKYCKS